MAEGAKVARDHGADLLDINMGCPVPKITRNGAGSALLCDPARAASLVDAVKRASGLPVSVKIRSGWDSTRQNAPEVARALEQGGACAIAIHPRTRAQGYTGLADWSMITRVKQAVKVPVVGNGDVKSKADAERMLLETGCDAVMIGRGALGNPWIFREVLGGAGPTPEERLAMVLRHLTEHIEFSGDTLNGVRSFRKTLLWYAHGLHGASAFRTIAARIDGFSEVREAIVRFFSEARADAPGGDGEQDIDLRAAYG